MDEELRRLRREAAAGDDGAALEWWRLASACPPEVVTATPVDTPYGRVVLIAEVSVGGRHGVRLETATPVSFPCRDKSGRPTHRPYRRISATFDFYGSPGRWYPDRFLVEDGYGLIGFVEFRELENGGDSVEFEDVAVPLAKVVEAWAETDEGRLQLRLARAAHVRKTCVVIGEQIEVSRAHLATLEKNLAEAVRGVFATEPG